MNEYCQNGQMDLQYAWINHFASVHGVVQQAHTWIIGAHSLRQYADNERVIARRCKNNSIVIKLLSPIFSVIIAMALFVGSQFVFLNEDASSATLFWIIAAVAETFFLAYPFGAKAKIHNKKAIEYEDAAAHNIQKAQKIMTEYAEVLSVLPSKYLYPLATGYVLELFQTGRASSVPIALDKLEEQIHRWNMEMAMQQTLAYQISQMQTLHSIQNATTLTAVAAAKYIIKK